MKKNKKKFVTGLMIISILGIIALLVGVYVCFFGLVRLTDDFHVQPAVFNAPSLGLNEYYFSWEDNNIQMRSSGYANAEYCIGKEPIGLSCGNATNSYTESNTSYKNYPFSYQVGNIYYHYTTANGYFGSKHECFCPHK
jgi:hypothetical protein